MSVRRREDATVLGRLRQSGCLKARTPRAENAGWLDLVTLNVSGGVAAGDRLESAFAVGEGARANIAGQAAERFYRALPGAPPARLRTSVSVAAGGFAEWLPQQSILFDGCALDRELSVELARDASFLGVETLVFGRAAMGESVAGGRVRDVIRIRRDGRLLLHDAVRLNGAIAEHLARPAVAAGARAVATLIYVAPEAEAFVERARAALYERRDDEQPDARVKRGHDGVQAGVSGWEGMLLARMLAPDGATLRAAIVAGLQAIRGGRTLPRVWLC